MGSGRSSGGAGSTQRQVTTKTREQSIKGAVGANDEQWNVIKPRLDKVKRLRQEACMVIRASGGGSASQSSSGPQAREGTPTTARAGGAAGGGAVLRGEKSGGGSTETTKDGVHTWMKWSWGRGWGATDAQRTDQKLCYELFNLLHGKNANAEEIKQKIDALRKARQETKSRLTKAQMELREVLTLDQEARLVALGWLD